MNAYSTCPMAIAKARTATYNVQRWRRGELAESFFSSSEGLVLIGVVQLILNAEIAEIAEDAENQRTDNLKSLQSR
jgi:hypothetical protein